MWKTIIVNTLINIEIPYNQYSYIWFWSKWTTFGGRVHIFLLIQKHIYMDKNEGERNSILDSKNNKKPCLQLFFQLILIFVYSNNCLLKFFRDNAQIVTTGAVNKLILCLAPKQLTENYLGWKTEKQSEKNWLSDRRGSHCKWKSFLKRPLILLPFIHCTVYLSKI